MSRNHLPLTLPALLEYAASQQPGAIAYIECHGAERLSVTWTQLREGAQATAEGLVAIGLQRGDRVALCAENSIDWITAAHAIALAGGVAVLIYPELKDAEIGQQISHPVTRFLIASAAVLDRIALPELEAVVSIGESSRASLSFAKLPSRATAESRQLLASQAPSPGDLAAIIYTSGTTGGAKGVMLSHRNLLSNAAAASQAMSFSHRDSTLLVLPLHHAFAFLAAIVLAGLVQATVVIENDLRRLRDRLQEFHPSVFFAVPALYEIVYRNIMARAESEGRLQTLQTWQERVRWLKQRTGINIGPLVFKSLRLALGGRLRFLISGGAALNPQLVRDYASLGLPLLQGWGMSEASPAIAFQRYSPLRFLLTRFYEDHAGSVGPALPGVEVRLIDVPEKGIQVAESGEGEVTVRGDNVFQGYWNAPEASAQAMQDGWLKTGDMARIDHDGNIFLTGRSKYIIVLDSGEKVHPDELEEVYSASELIEDICVRERRDSRDKVQVSALVYPKPEACQALLNNEGEPVTESALRTAVGAEIEQIGRGLAAYKRVARIELTDSPLPKTALLKVARGQLQDDYEFSVERWFASAAVQGV